MVGNRCEINVVGIINKLFFITAHGWHSYFLRRLWMGPDSLLQVIGPRGRVIQSDTRQFKRKLANGQTDCWKCITQGGRGRGRLGEGWLRLFGAMSRDAGRVCLARPRSTAYPLFTSLESDHSLLWSWHLWCLVQCSKNSKTWKLKDIIAHLWLVFLSPMTSIRYLTISVFLFSDCYKQPMADILDMP